MNNDSNNSINNNNAPQTNNVTEPTNVNPAPVSEPAAPTPATEPVAPVSTPEVTTNNPAPAPAENVQEVKSENTSLPAGTVNLSVGTTPTNGDANNTEVKQEKKSFNVKILIYIVAIIALIGALVFLLLGKNTKTAKIEKMENVSISGSSCVNSACTVTLGNDGKNYAFYEVDADFFLLLSNYQDYIQIDVYHTLKENVETIVGYQIYLKETSEDISYITTENDLNEKLGLYGIGTQTDTFTLTEIGLQGVGEKDNKSYTFTNSSNKQYTMSYDEANGELDLAEGVKYRVTFTVTKGTVDYEYSIVQVEVAE